MAFKPGLMAEYFYFTQGDSLPNLDSRVPDVTRIEPRIDYADSSQAWVTGGQSTNFAVRWTGHLIVSTAGEYTFYLGSDDGSKLFLNGAMIIDNDGLHSFRTRTSVPVSLGVGPQRITILYFQRSGANGARFQYQGPDSGGQVVTVPSTVLGHGEYGELPTLSFLYNLPDASPMISGMSENGLVLHDHGHDLWQRGHGDLRLREQPEHELPVHDQQLDGHEHYLHTAHAAFGWMAGAGLLQ